MSQMVVSGELEPKRRNASVGKPKRKHHLAACSSCKKKRKRCDGAYPVCLGCAMRRIECTVYDHTIQRVIPRNYIQTLEERIVALEKNQAKTASRPSSPGLGPAQLETAQLEAAQLETGSLAQSDELLVFSDCVSVVQALANPMDLFEKKELRVSIPPFSKPSHEDSEMYLSIYHRQVHIQYPLLDWSWTQNACRQVINTDSQDTEHLFFLYIVCAIGAQLMRKTTFARMYYKKSIEYFGSIIDSESLSTVQAYLLIVIYALNTPNASTIWQTLGLAVRAAVALGLHRRPYRQENMELKSRVFWSAYCLDRLAGVVFGRPFAISDEDIDMPFPKETPETTAALHMVRLRRVQSSICNFLNRPVLGMEESAVDLARVEMTLQLNEWMSSFSQVPLLIPLVDALDWVKFLYNYLMMILLRPVVLEVLKLRRQASLRTLEWFRVFAHSALAICTCYRDFHVKGSMNYSWLAMHCIFVAGLSFLYCLWLDFSAQVLDWVQNPLINNTITACSEVLSEFVERFPEAEPFRNTFERVSLAVMSKIEDKHDSLGHKNSIDTVVSMGVAEYLGLEAIKLDPSRELDTTMWEFLDSTGDKFLRVIFNELEIFSST